MKTLNITSHRMLNDRVAQVVVAYTGDYSQDEFHKALVAKLDGKGGPVENSFRQVTAGAVVGFVRANKEVRVVDPQELRAAYRVLSSNMMMDNKDRSLWDVESSANGVFLTRHGNEDLSELVASATHHGRQDLPKAHTLTAGAGQANELVTFVTEDGELEHGFVLRSNEDSCIVEARVGGTIKVPFSHVSSFHDVEVEEEVVEGVAQELRAAMDGSSKADARAYYRTLFSHDKDYMQKMLDAVDQSSFA